MNRIDIVIGTSYGDEAKGSVTNILTNKYDNPIVIRFNGGHQAGHTVIEGNHRHVFSNFGSGSLNGIPTYWSKYCTFNPASLLMEYEQLKEKCNNLKIYVDNLCPVTTYYDIIYNQLIEDLRGNGRHGSCGVGYGTTVERSETPYKLFAQDLLYPNVLKNKLNSIRSYYIEKFHQLNPNKEIGQKFLDKMVSYSDDITYNLIDRLINLINEDVLEFVIESEIMNKDKFDGFIFEGAQGILLDMDFGYFPNVTRSNTTSKNAWELIKNLNVSKDEVNVWYLTRAYQTRHGAGPMNNEDKPITLKNNENETNVSHSYQGNFRTGILDLDEVKYAIQCDNNFSHGATKKLSISCLDQVDPESIEFTYLSNRTKGSMYDVSNILGFTQRDTLYKFKP